MSSFTELGSKPLFATSSPGTVNSDSKVFEEAFFFDPPGRLPQPLAEKG